MAQYDVVVCGLGVMGSAALYQLARRGRRVLGLDRFSPGHDRGSSHGETRIIRLAYFEHPSYVPLMRRAYELWRELEVEAARPLLHITGIAEIGPPDGTLVSGTLAAARLHDIPHELVAASELTRRYPAFRLPPHFVGVVQPDGGFIEAEASVQSMLALARRHGAEIRFGEPVRAHRTSKSRSAHRDRRRDHRCRYRHHRRRAVDPITARRRHAAVARDAAGHGLVRPAGTRSIRTRPLPRIPDRKPRTASTMDFPRMVPESRSRNITIATKRSTRIPTTGRVSAEDEALIRAAVAEHLPGANGPLMDAKTCLYTVAPDGDFIIDRLPGAASILVASPCSGHGFKFAPVIGEILADLASGLPPRHDISRFRIDRFG